MKRLTLAIASALYLPLAAVAAVPVAGTPDPAAPVVLRLSTDGNWLGVLRADASTDGSPELIIAPVQPGPRGAALAPLTIGGLFNVPLGESGRVFVGAEQSWSPTNSGFAVPSAWCQGMVGMVANADECLVAGVQSSGQPAVVHRMGTLGWAGNLVEVAMSYGSAGAHSLPGQAATPAQLLLSPLPSVFAGLPGTIDSRDLSFSGMWRLAPWGGIALTASVSESSLTPVSGISPLALDQAAVQLGLTHGAFSGGITGRLVRPRHDFESNSPYWTGLDIGISWRTPWRGELSLGAQNLMGRSSSAQPTPAAPVIDEATARTPYVRYTQDL